jgi:CheY-like chemotaxis protein
LGGGRVLIVDDEPIVRNSFSRLLRGLGLSVQVASDGIEGLARCSEETFDVVILDLHMPNMGGAEMAARLRETQPELPLVIMSGNFSGEIVSDFEQDHRVRMIHKPASLDEVVQALRAVGLKKSASEHSPESNDLDARRN